MTQEVILAKQLAFGEWLKTLPEKNHRWSWLADGEKQREVVDFVSTQLTEVMHQLPEWSNINSAFEETSSAQWNESLGLVLSNIDSLSAESENLILKCIKLMDLFCQDQERQQRLKTRSKQKRQKKQRKQSSEVKPDSLLPPSTQSDDGKLEEGALRQISLTKRERNPEARQKCLAHYGYKCQGCSFDFEAYYGPAGREYIEVHHLNPIAASDGTHDIDPVVGLVPLCSNCHSIIHRAGTDVLHPISLEKLKQLIAENGKR